MSFFVYRNWRGEVRKVHVDLTQPYRIWIGSTEHHTKPQWLLTAFDTERQDVRTYALSDVLSWHIEGETDA